MYVIHMRVHNTMHETMFCVKHNKFYVENYIVSGIPKSICIQNVKISPKDKVVWLKQRDWTCKDKRHPPCGWVTARYFDDKKSLTPGKNGEQLNYFHSRNMLSFSST